MKNNTLYFTCHKETSYIGLMGAIGSVALVEMVGFYFLFKDWHPWVHITHLFLSLSTLEVFLHEPIVIKKKSIQHIFFFVDEKEKLIRLLNKEKDNQND